MDIRQLKRFLDLCETGSFTKTAENLFLTQQALSSSMNALEQELEHALFKRTPKGVIPTEKGLLLKELCSPVVADFDEMVSEVNRRFDNKRGALLMGLAPGVLQASAPDLLLQFRRTHPNFELKAIEGLDNVCLENVLNGTVELSFCSKPHDAPATEYIHLGTERLCAVVNRESPLAGQKTVSIADLQTESLVSLNKYNEVYHTIMSCCRSNGFTPNFVVETAESGILLSMVKRNGCVFICMEYIAEDMDKTSCVKIPISDESMVWEYGIVYKKEKKLDHNAQLFLDFVNKFKL